MYDYCLIVAQSYNVTKKSIVLLPYNGAFHGARDDSMDGLPTYSLSSSDFVPSHLSEFPIPALISATKKPMAVPKAQGTRALPGVVMQEQRKHQHIAKAAIPQTMYAISFFITLPCLLVVFPIH